MDHVHKTFMTIEGSALGGEADDSGDTFILGVNNELHSLLTQYKNDITRFYKARRWDRGKKFANDFELVYTSQGDGMPSIADVSPASRSYFKMWEILTDFGDDMFPGGVSSSSEPRRCCFLAEGPGGFLEAYATMRGDMLGSDTLHGMTLSPRLGHMRGSATSVPYWRLPPWIAQRAKRLCICNGSSGNGDICSPSNLDALLSDTNGTGTCHLVSADGGFDFTGDFNGQEQSSAVLVASEIRAALLLQAPGGCFVLKIFDVNCYKTFQLINILVLAYKHVHIVKPLTSRPANSEKYLVCVGFTGCPVHITDALLAFIQHPITNTGPIGNIPYVPTSILYAFTQYNCHVVKHQLFHISRTIASIEVPVAEAQMMLRQQVGCALRWCYKYNIGISSEALRVYRTRLNASCESTKDSSITVQ